MLAAGILRSAIIHPYLTPITSWARLHRNKTNYRDRITVDTSLRKPHNAYLSGDDQGRLGTGDHDGPARGGGQRREAPAGQAVAARRLRPLRRAAPHPRLAEPRQGR